MTTTSTVDVVTMDAQSNNKQNTKKTFKTMTMKERLIYVKEVITVEPIIAAYVISSILCLPALYTLEFEKACLANLNLNDTICTTIISGDEHNYTQENNEIQILISNMHTWQQPLQSIMPLILVLFLGSYSDRHRIRKPFLILPIIGEFLAVIGCIMCVIFMKEWPLEVQGVAQTVIPSFFGGQTMIVMATFAYIADVSTLEMRTIRVAVVQLVLNICIPITQSYSGVLFANIGYIGMLLIAAGFYLFAVIYAVFAITEPSNNNNTTVDVITNNETIKVKGFFVDAFDPKHALETFNLLFKKSPGNNRLLIVIVLVIMFIYSTVIVGESSILYLYVQKIFNWTTVDYTYFTTTNTIVHLIGISLGIPLFVKILNIGDWLLIAVSFIDFIVSNIFFILAKTVTMFYVASVVGIFTGISSVAIRSLGTKVVSENDLGKAQSLFGICEALGPAIAIPIYNTGIYVNTLETYPAAYFYLGIILYGLSLIVIFWMFFREKRQVIVAKNGEVKPQPQQTNGSGKNGTINENFVPDEYQTTHM